LAVLNALGKKDQDEQGARGAVLLYVRGKGEFANQHDAATRREIGRRLAALKGFDFEGEHEPGADYPGPLYFIPSDTILGDEAAVLGIDTEDDLFGGVVPHPFVATKAISHALVDPAAAAPEGWSHDFARHMEGGVVEGFTAFTPDDARRAARILLERGPLRLKPVLATSGQGQVTIEDEKGFSEALEEQDQSQLAEFGLVLEEDLADVETYSVGLARVGDLVLSYVGTQGTTSNGRGEEVYGGSDLLFARGGLDALLALDLPQPVRLAVIQASLYDAAALKCFPGLFASRRNYDVAQGMNARGKRCSGVLEQSWRLGGATGAEIAAMEAFAQEPERDRVRACTVERYGEYDPPSGATVYFHGTDEVEGPMVKYAMVRP
jgi:hypothetical protein